MITAQLVLDRVRRVLHDDAVDAYRWPDSTLIGYLNDAQQDLRKVRPDYWLSLLGVIGVVVLADEYTQDLDLTLDESLLKGLAGYVSSACLSEDESDMENLQRAQMQRAEYNRIATGQ